MNLSYSNLIDIKLEGEQKLITGARSNLLWYTKYTKPNYMINWHHRVTARYLMRWIAGEIPFLIIEEPPRHGKTELVNRRMVPYIFGQNPNAAIIGASYSGELASRVNREIQRVMDTPRHLNVFPQARLSSKKTAYTGEKKPLRNNDEFEIVGHTGSYRGVGVGGAITGMGCQYLIIDDPVKDAKEADSQNKRDSIWDWFVSTALSRVEDNSRILINMTRWHDDDLVGRLLQQRDAKGDHAFPWTELRIPAIRDNMDMEEDPREIGDALWPYKYDKARLAKIEATSGPRWFSALYQQRPQAASGGMFTQSMFEFASIAGKEWQYTFVMADTAYKDKQENDYTVFTVFGVDKDNELYVLDVWRKRIKAKDVEAPVTTFVTGYQGYSFRGVYIEPKGHGIYLNQILPTKGVIMPSDTMIEKFFADRKWDKVQRANNAIPFLGNRKIRINENINDKQELVNECLKFPRAAHDDFVDTVIDGIKFTYASSHGILDVL